MHQVGIKLSERYYQSENVVEIAQDLLGKILVTNIKGQLTSGMIVETEAYKGPEDKASHAYNNRRTKRTEIMFGSGGLAYVYLCYGIHHLFNVVTGPENVPHAVLIRGIEPLQGTELMLKRRNFEQIKTTLSAGPGTLSAALGIHTEHTGLSLTGNKIWIEDIGTDIGDDQIVKSPRVGIDYAEEFIQVPWRFRIKDSKWTSPAK